MKSLLGPRCKTINWRSTRAAREHSEPCMLSNSARACGLLECEAPSFHLPNPARYLARLGKIKPDAFSGFHEQLSRKVSFCMRPAGNDLKIWIDVGSTTTLLL